MLLNDEQPNYAERELVKYFPFGGDDHQPAKVIRVYDEGIRRVLFSQDTSRMWRVVLLTEAGQRVDVPISFIKGGVEDVE